MALAIYVPVAVIFLCAAAQVLSDVLTWLKTAHTSGYTNARLLYDVGVVNQQTGWLGLQKFLDRVLAWPAWSGLFFTGVILFIVGAGVTTKLEKIEQRVADAKTSGRR
jgi:hypothetical protein